MKQRKKWQTPKIKEGKLTRWHWKVIGLKKFKMGQNTDIGSFTLIQARGGVRIDDDVQIGSHCVIYSESTIDDKKGAVWIKKGAKIGTHSTIMPGVVIGKNAIVGAHSFVKKDIPDNKTAYGIPARVVRKRKI